MSTEGKNPLLLRFLGLSEGLSPRNRFLPRKGGEGAGTAISRGGLSPLVGEKGFPRASPFAKSLSEIQERGFLVREETPDGGGHEHRVQPTTNTESSLAPSTASRGRNPDCGIGSGVTVGTGFPTPA